MTHTNDPNENTGSGPHEQDSFDAAEQNASSDASGANQQQNAGGFDGVDIDKASHALAFLDAPEGPAITSTDDERSFAGIVHLSGLLGLVTAGLGGVIGPLVLWLIKKEQSAFLNDQGKEALNFQITVFIAAVALSIVLVILVAITLGFGVFCAFPISLAFVVFWVLAMVRATLIATKGGAYRYKYCLRLIK